MDLKPVIVGPPGYGSPDPDTQLGRLVPLDQHPLVDSISDDYAADLQNQTVTVPDNANFVGESQDSDTEENATDGAVELAVENDVDLDEVQGTGRDGRVTKADVEKFLEDRNNS